MQKVAVIGLGYVGLPLALLTKEKGYDTVGVDINKSLVDTINSGKSPIADDHLQKWVAKSDLKATTNPEEIKDADIILICVPTPVKNHTEPDLGPVRGATEMVAKVMKKGALVVVESTINPGVCDDVVLPLLLQASGFKESEFDLAHCPERINPGDTKWSVRNINRVVGGHTDKALKRAAEFYESIIEGEVKKMGSLKEAEAVKVVENSFRDINIAFVNELAMSFQRMGVNIENVIDGAATKPFAFMAHRPGAGVGGHCIPVDPYYLIEYAKSYDFHHEFLSLARKINSEMPDFTVGLLQDRLNDKGLALKGAEIALLGLSYKANVDDDRESPSYDIQRILDEHGAVVRTFDPYIPANSTHETLALALKGADGVIVATGHNEFTKLSAKDFANYGIKALVDGRNVFRHQVDEFKKAGIAFSGIGVS